MEMSDESVLVEETKKNAYIHTDDGQLWKENNIKVVEMALAHLLVEFCFLLSE